MEKSSQLRNATLSGEQRRIREQKSLFTPARIARSFRVWIAVGYVTLLVLLIFDIILTYRHFSALRQELLTEVSSMQPPAQARLLGVVEQHYADALYREIGVLCIGVLVALVSFYATARGLLRPLGTIGEMLSVASDDTSQTLEVSAMPTELRSLAQRYNAMIAALRQRQDELHDQLRRTALLTRLSLELREALDPDVVVRDVLTAIVSNSGAASASIIVCDGRNGAAQAYTTRGKQTRLIDTPRAKLLLEKGLAGWVLRHGYTVVLPNVQRDERWLKLPSSQPDNSAMALPLTHTRTTLGVLTVTHPEQEYFTSKDLLLLEGVAALAGVALSSANRHIQEQRRREQALLLFAMSQSITVQRSLDDLSEELLTKSCSAFDATHTALFLSQQEHEAPRLFGVYSRPTLHERDAAILNALNEQIPPIATQVWREHKAVSGALKLKSDMANTEGALRSAFVALPLLHNGNASGVFVLVCDSRDTVVFSADMWSVLTIFTNVAAAAFTNARLVEQLHQRAETLSAQVNQRTAQLQHSRDLLRIVFDNLPDGLILLDSRATILTANNAFCRGVLGAQPQNVVRHHYPAVLQQLHHDHQLQIEPELNSAPTQRIRCTKRNKQQFWYDIDRYTIGPAGNEQRIERWRDVTRQEEIHRQLLLHEQLASIGKLALSVVHEVGNPLQSVRGCLDLCREENNLSESASDYLALADRELERMAQLLERLRDLYRPQELAWEHVQLNDIISTVQRITDRQMQRYHVQLQVVLAPTLPRVYAQPDALRQVLLNLVLNAQEAMVNGGTLQIATAYHAEQHECSIQICDNGIGIAPEEVARIFEPFNSTKARGLGLGLYLSKQMIDQHQGRIIVQSTPQVGTCVTVYLPYHTETNE